MLADVEADLLGQCLGVSPPASRQAGQGRPALSKEALAIAALKDHPDWTDGKIAKAAGCNAKSLYRMKGYTTAKAALRQGGADIPRGSKSEDGTIEAWDDTTTDDFMEPSDS